MLRSFLIIWGTQSNYIGPKSQDSFLIVAEGAATGECLDRFIIAGLESGGGVTSLGMSAASEAGRSKGTDLTQSFWDGTQLC